MLFELRQFRIKDGKRERWVRLIEEKIIPFQISKGIVVIASFVGVDEPDLYIWIRRLKMRRKLEGLYKDVYESDYWITQIKPQADEMAFRDRRRITRLMATEKSLIQ